ncbi:MAG: cytochrome c [Burkholderiaceae bacterium]|jgi:cytochrome c553|nr:cytochrome c [Burkholderiaceae bacterium]
MNHRSISMIAISLLFCATAQAQTATGNAAAGQYDSAMCEGCHNAHGGFKTDFPAVYRAPKLNGQSAAYIAQCLQDYRSGARRNPTMKAVADILTPRQIADLSAYYAVEKNQNVK